LKDNEQKLGPDQPSVIRTANQKITSETMTRRGAISQVASSQRLELVPEPA
jgi:hypothetical protein